MTIITEQLTTPPLLYLHAAEVETLRPRLDALIDEIVSSALSADMFDRALAAGVTEISSVLRAVPIAEGRLLERGIALIAGINPDLAVLTTNLRLPVTRAATELVEMNDPALYRSLSLDADNGGRKSYTPDLLILNRRTEIAHMVDVKRSLGSYEVSRIAELKNRMLAAALVVPDLLYKEHRRLHAKEVRVVILNAENQRSDIEGGVWPLSHLDHLLEVTGARQVMECLRQLFQEKIEGNWSAAMHSHGKAKALGEVKARHDGSEVTSDFAPPRVVSSNDTTRTVPRPPIQIGFARPPRATSH